MLPKDVIEELFNNNRVLLLHKLLKKDSLTRIEVLGYIYEVYALYKIQRASPAIAEKSLF